MPEGRPFQRTELSYCFPVQRAMLSTKRLGFAVEIAVATSAAAEQRSRRGREDSVFAIGRGLRPLSPTERVMTPIDRKEARSGGLADRRAASKKEK